MLKEMSVEELMNIEVFSVSKRPERLSETPSAIQVITGEDIRRSGVKKLADALRLASNLGVQQIASHAWVVSSRGFNTLFANKLLVMIDGRSVYTSLDAGVFWDAQNVLLEDIDRIEVISGPGGTLWGSNAVNGVINIITKSSKETQGTYASAAAGSFQKNHGVTRYGSTIGDNTFFRVYANRADYDNTFFHNGNDGIDEWYMTSGGFRLDYFPSDTNMLTLQGDMYGGGEFNSAMNKSQLDGGNILGRWKHMFSRSSDLTVQVYFDRTWRRDIPSTISDEMITYDLDAQHSFAIGQRQNILWGIGYRLMQNETPTSSAFVGFVPEHRNMDLFSAFMQDEITLQENVLKLTIGTKIEHNDFSGLEIQPSGRLAWTPNEQHTAWGAISRAVRSPSRIDVDYHIPKAPLVSSSFDYYIAGGPDFESETVVAYELGYRIQPIQTISLSVATFYNRYDKIYSVEQESSSSLFPFTIQNGVEGQSWGAEFSGIYQPTEWWRLRGGYTYFHKDLWNRPGHNVQSNVFASLGNDPRNQCVLQSMTDLPANFQFDITARYVDILPDPKIPSYGTFDARLAWQYQYLELSIVGQNLWRQQHTEFGGLEIPRSVYGKVACQF
jgi:iron complex outermembrane receptor protein